MSLWVPLSCKTFSSAYPVQVQDKPAPFEQASLRAICLMSAVQQTSSPSYDAGLEVERICRTSDCQPSKRHHLVGGQSGSAELNTVRCHRDIRHCRNHLFNRNLMDIPSHKRQHDALPSSAHTFHLAQLPIAEELEHLSQEEIWQIRDDPAGRTHICLKGGDKDRMASDCKQTIAGDRSKMTSGEQRESCCFFCCSVTISSQLNCYSTAVLQLLHC